MPGNQPGRDRVLAGGGADPAGAHGARRLDEDVLAILKANSRLPDSLWGDLNGQLAALELGAGRLDDLLQEYGDDTVRAALDTLRQRARRLMLDHVASLPDGEYRYRDTLDNDGVKDAELTIALRLRVSGERLELDFSETSPACAGRSISRAPPPWPPATWRSSTCSRTCRPMPACWTR